jgi:hypothetical protein
MFAESADFPPWLVLTSLSFAVGAAGLLVYGSRRPAAEPPPVNPPLPSDAPVPPPPAAPVAGARPADLPAGADRRAGFRRVGNAVEAVICDEHFTQPARRGWVLDRSRLGLRLSLLEKCDCGTALKVRPADAPESAPWLAVEVRNVQAGDGCWELGCRFVSEPSWDVLMLFG